MSTMADDACPLEFFQHTVPPTCLLRIPAMRVFNAKDAALGCERLWSVARQMFTDKRRSLRTKRIMQLLNVKLNAKLLRGDINSIGPNEFLYELEASFDSIFETVALMEEEEAAAALAKERAHGTSAAGSNADLEDIEDVWHDDVADAPQPLDMFSMD